MRRLLALGLLVCLSVCFWACSNVQRDVAALDATQIAEGVARVKYIAHRGHCSAFENGIAVTLGENTAESFANAAKMPAFWGIETDVWQTADGVLVCMHDKDAVEGIGDVHRADSADVLSRPLKKSPEYHAPTFETYLGICRDADKVAVVEIKDKDMSEDCLVQVLAAIEQSGVKATVISFYLDKVAYVRAQNASIECMLLCNKNWNTYYRRSYGQSTSLEALFDTLLAQHIGLSVDYKYLYNQKNNGGEWLDLFHRSGLTVGVWTVDDSSYAVLDATAGVDYITTNTDPARLVAGE